MPHLVESLRRDAEAAILRMQEAARAARRVHARAELMRHMLTTATKVKQQPKAEAIEMIVREWMVAWNLGRTEWPHVAREMEGLTEAFYDYAHAPTDAHDERLRSFAEALDAAFAAEGTSIADQMAFRSQCAHGWWEWVEPVPGDLPGLKERPSVPGPRAEGPFWTLGCADFCR